MNVFMKRSVVTTAMAMVLSVSCTMKNQDAPPLTGPSEFGTSVTLNASPDTLQQDGASQSQITITTFDQNGKPKGGVPMTVEIRFGGEVTDFGWLSARSATTNSAGKATLAYTAPVSIGAETLVEIVATPIGTNAVNQVGRSVAIRLIPPGIRLPPLNLTPSFTMSTSAPAQGQPVIFDAQASTGAIAQYRWEFGDGATGSGEIVTHAYSELGSYIVRLTLVDTAGRTISLSRSVSVGQSLAPTAEFTFSPANPQPNDEVRFNASASVPAAGRTIVSYVWDFGDGNTATGVQATRRYTQARTYNVTLTVTDDLGRTAVVTKPIDVAVPEDDGGTSPN
jgi:PKD repeat protein